MRWLALTFGGSSCASAEHRVHQYVPLLEAQGIFLECLPAVGLRQLDLPQLRQYDGILLQKKLPAWPLRRKLARSGLPLIFDTDDATWHPHSRRHHFFTRQRTSHRLAAILKLADRVLTANGCLARELALRSRCVEVLPMTLPLAEWRSAPPRDGPVVLGWAGAPHNQLHLLHIAAALQNVKRARPGVVVRVFSGVRPTLNLDFEFVPFQARRQTEVLTSFSVGLLPLPDTPFNHGKSPIKALQYMASGIPCVASPLSGTMEMLGEEGGAFYATDTRSWTEGLLRLVDDAKLRQQLGERSRQRYEALHTTEAVATRLAAILKEVAAQAKP